MAASRAAADFNRSIRGDDGNEERSLIAAGDGFNSQVCVLPNQMLSNVSPVLWLRMKAAKPPRCRCSAPEILQFEGVFPYLLQVPSHLREKLKNVVNSLLPVAPSHEMRPPTPPREGTKFGPDPLFPVVNRKCRAAALHSRVEQVPRLLSLTPAFCVHCGYCDVVFRP